MSDDSTILDNSMLRDMAHTAFDLSRFGNSIAVPEDTRRNQAYIGHEKEIT